MKKLIEENSERNIPNVILARATVADMRFFFTLRNESRVRKTSFNKNHIEWGEHREWFLKMLKRPDSCAFVVKVNRKKVGQVRMDFHGNSSDISVSIAPSDRRKGYAAITVDAASRYVFKKYPNVNKIFAYIKPSNIASIKTFKKAGFRRFGIVKHKGNKASKMALIR